MTNAASRPDANPTTELAGQRAPSAAAADAAARRAMPAGSRLGSARYVREMAAVWARRALTDCLSE
jgi:hypothetical protein